MTPEQFTLTLASGTSGKMTITRQTCWKMGKIVFIAITLNVTSAYTGYIVGTGQIPVPLHNSGYSASNSIINSTDSSGQRTSIMADGRLYSNESLSVGAHAYTFTYLSE